MFYICFSTKIFFLDIRYAAHGSPYYAPEKMEGKIAESKLDIERQLGMQTAIYFVNSYLFVPDPNLIKLRNKLRRYVKFRLPQFYFVVL